MPSSSPAGATDRNVTMFQTPRLSFLIFASPKSGTTWMQRLLSAHPAVLCTESRLFGNYFHPNPLSNPHLSLQKYVSILSSHFAPMEGSFHKPENQFQKRVLFNFINTLADTSLAVSNKSVYGEKLTPFRGTGLEVVETLSQYNPDVKFVNLTRDGRDVMVSGAAQWLNLRVKSATSESEKAKWLTELEQRRIHPEDFENFISLWSDAVTAGLHARQLFKNYLPLKYEVFLADPLGEAKRLLEFLQVDASPEVVQACVRAASFEALSGGRTSGAEDRNSFFRKGVSGDWKNWFTESETKAFVDRAGHLLTQSGYAL